MFFAAKTLIFRRIFDFWEMEVFWEECKMAGLGHLTHRKNVLTDDIWTVFQGGSESAIKTAEFQSFDFFLEKIEKIVKNLSVELRS